MNKLLRTTLPLFLGLPLYACTGTEDAMPNTVRNDIEGLKEYVDAPFVVNSVTYELVISPPPGGLPAPTDWVGLAAIIETEKDTVRSIGDIFPTTTDCALSQTFALPWYGHHMEDIGRLGRSAWNGERVCYDAQSLLVKKAGRAFIAPIDDSKLFLYVEYMKP